MWYDQLKTSAPDWSVIAASFPHYGAMRACMQDAIHHGEGDVWTHTRMVADEIAKSGGDGERLRLTALFHDVEKPGTRVEEAGRVSHPRHARRGAKTAWYDLWRRGHPLGERLAIYRLILWHQKVFHLWETYERGLDAFERAALEFSESGGSWEELLRFARADNLGRVCADRNERNDGLLLIEEALRDEGLPLDGATAFPDAYSRIFYLEKEGRSRHHMARRPSGSEVTILSGLPGVGKDTWARRNRPDLPVVSADEIRKELNVTWTDDQGTVVQTVKERARTFLRSRESFIWNATNVTAQMRRSLVGLCRDYDARVRIVAFDAPLEVILGRNAERENVVPTAAIATLAHKLEPVLPSEAHEVVWVEG